MKRRDFLATSAGAISLGHLLATADTPTTKTKSPFLEGNFAPIREEVSANKLKVIGKLPAELDGLYVRNGPNPQFEPLGRYHWFDGDGMLHGVRLRDGQASYRNRYVQTEGWQEEKKAGKTLHTGLLAMPDLKKIAQGKEGHKNAANTALVWYNGQLLALWEGGAPHAIKVPDLDTSGRFTFDGKLKHPFTAHPKIDTTTGEMMFFGYGAMAPFLQYSVANAKGEIVRTTPIELPRGVMMHDFAVTEKHTLFLDLPEVFDFQQMLKGGSVLRFDAKLGARVGILPRHGTNKEVKWFEIKTCFVFHTLNAWEEGDEITLLACRMKEFAGDISQTPLGTLPPKDELPYLYRWRFNLKTDKVQEEALDDVACDFPRLDDARMGKKHRYGYTMHLSMEGYTKYDLEKGKSETHLNGKGRFGGEGVFVPRPDAKQEDDGWLLSYVHDETAGKSELVVIDCREFRKPPPARVVLPQRVPYGFHGTWIAGKLMDK